MFQIFRENRAEISCVTTGRTAVTACAGPGPASCHKTEGIDIQLNIDLISTLAWLSNSENQNKRVMFMYSLSFSSSYCDCDKRQCWECSGVIVNACTWMRESWMVGLSECLRSTLRHTRLREGKGEAWGESLLDSGDRRRPWLGRVWAEEDEERGADRMQNNVTRLDLHNTEEAIMTAMTYRGGKKYWC